MSRLSTLPQDMMTRAAVRSVPCPDCGANANEKCAGAGGKLRASSHAARWGAYRKAADSSNRKGTEMTTKKIYGPHIDWNGGECPVPPETKVEVEFRGGAVREARAGDYYWSHYDDDDDGDIVSYRTVTEQPDLDAAERLLRDNGYTIIPPAKPLTFEDVVPMTEAPPEGTVYWVVSALHGEGVFCVRFFNAEFDPLLLKRRMAYPEKEHALIAARHIFGLKGGEL